MSAPDSTVDFIPEGEGKRVYGFAYTAKNMAVTRYLMPLAAIFITIVLAASVAGWTIAALALLGLVFGLGIRLLGLGGEGLLTRHHRSTPP